MMIFLFALFAATSAVAATKPAPFSYGPTIESFRRLLGELVGADTTNPPGNEASAVKYVAARLEAENVPYEIVEFAPGRSNIVARLKGDGSDKPLMLLAHLDVVGTQHQKWSTDPHALTEKDGYLYGRGVGDDLGMAAMELEVFLLLKRSATPLRRDVILALTGDEESGGDGIRYLLKHRPELVDASVVLNEGGGPVIGEDGRVKLVALQAAEKTYQDFALHTVGATGHSSVPLIDNAIYRLALAIDKVRLLPMPVLLSPVTRRYLDRRAALEKEPVAKAMRSLASTKEPVAASVALLDKDPLKATVLRTTCVVTMVSGGIKENALPPDARANVNCRILPGETVDQVKARLVKAINDPKVKVELAGILGSAGASPVEGEVVAAVERVAKQRWPGAVVIPTMSSGATDSRFLRAQGVAAYGINPIAMSEEDARRAHGIDERIPVASLEPGLAFLHTLVGDLAGKHW